MTRLYVVCEGQTEEAIVKAVLVGHLSTLGVYVTPVLVRTSQSHRGGGNWGKWERTISHLLREHHC